LICLAGVILILICIWVTGIFKVNNIVTIEKEATSTEFSDINRPDNKIKYITWEKSFPINESEIVTCITPLSSRDILISGISTSKDEYSSSYLWILKIDINGSILWKKEYQDIVYPPIYYPENNILPISNDGFIVVGGTKINDNKINAIVAQFDKDGNNIWEKSFKENDVISCFSSIVKDKNDDYFILGIKKCFKEQTNKYKNFEEELEAALEEIENDQGTVTQSDNIDGWIIKYNKNNDLLWQYNIGSRNDDEIPYKLEYKERKFFITGIKDDKLWINILDENLNSLWIKDNGEYYDDYPFISIIPSDLDHSCAFIGFRRSNKNNFIYETVFIKYDDTGNEQWSNKIEANYCSSIANTNDNGYLISCNISNSVSLIKFDSNGVNEGSKKIIEFTNINELYRTPTPLKQISNNEYVLAFLLKENSEQIRLNVNKFYIEDLIQDIEIEKTETIRKKIRNGEYINED